MRTQLLLCTLVLVLTGAASATAQIYSEDFTYGDGTTDPGDDSWSIDVSDANLADAGWFEVRNNRFEGNDLDGDAIWETEAIDITGAPSVRFSLNALETGFQESGDFFDVRYVLDGDTTLIENYNGLGSTEHTLSGNWSNAAVIQGGLTGSSLVVQVIMRNSAQNETFAFDDFLVELEPSGPTVQFITDALDETEGGSVTVSVQINNPDGNAVEVGVDLNPGESSAQSADLNGFASTTLTFDATANDGDRQSFELELDNDGEVEGTEIAVLDLNVTSGSATAISPSQLEVSIEDNDSPPVVINEIDVDQASNDTAEFIELFNPSNASVSLDGLVLVFFDGGDNASYRAADLDGNSIPANGYFVICGNPAGVANCDLDAGPSSNLIQNGPDAVALYLGDASDFPNDTPVTSDNLIDAIVYGVNDPDAAGLLAGLGESTQYDEDANDNFEGESLQRFPDGTQDIGAAAPTPGATNNQPVNLPVELISFEALADGSVATLSWTTASEENNTGFHVEHRRASASTDDATDHATGTFEALGFVEGHGTTSQAHHYRFQSAQLEAGRHVFRLRQVDFDGTASYSAEVEVEVAVSLPAGYRLSAAYPNPFNPRSVFELEVAQAQHVRVGLYDVLGRRVAVLFDGVVEAGSVQEVVIEGSALASGVYLYRAEGERFEATRQVSLIK